jgi:N-glycosylase/DNA lyase
MNLTAVNQTIRSLCPEILSLATGHREWGQLSEEDLFHEAVVCIFGSQTVFEVAVAAAHRVRSAGLLGWRDNAGQQDYEKRILIVLSAPMSVDIGGVRREMFLRFRNRLASLVASTVERIYGRGSSFGQILKSVGSAHQARELLVGAVAGFGPKQASLFLRRVGYCADLAVLDRHVLDYLRLTRGIDPKPGTLSRLPGYERIEAEFQRVATEFGHDVGCVDLAMWVTMRVAKREALA